MPEQVAGGLSFHVNAEKTEYMYFNKKRDSSTINGGSQKLVDKFTHLESRVSSTKNHMNMRLVKA